MFILPRRPTSKNSRNFCGAINAWTEDEISDNDNYFVLNIRTNGIETKQLVNNGLGDDVIVKLNNPVDSASPVGFLKQNVLHELKKRNPHLKIHPVDKKTRELHCGFTNDTINIIGKIVVRIRSNGWIDDENLFLSPLDTRGTFLPRIRIEIAQRQPLVLVNNVTIPYSCN